MLDPAPNLRIGLRGLHTFGPRRLADPYVAVAELLRLPDRLHARSMAGGRSPGRATNGARHGTDRRGPRRAAGASGPDRRGQAESALVRAASPIQTTPSSKRSAFQIGARALVSSIA